MKFNKQKIQIEKKQKKHKDNKNKELERYKIEFEDLKKHYLRALADYQNLEHRVEQERYKMRDSIKHDLVEQLLPILDSLDQAEIFNNDQGLQLISKSFRQSLRDFGVNEIELLGTEFDPSKAEAIEVVEGKQDNIIIEVLQKAYQINENIIRHGKVKVSRKKAE